MTTCFRTLGGTVFNVSNVNVPCSASNPTGCCVPGDICMSNGICRYTNPTAVESGYYLQSCTDSTFQSAIGQETLHCTTLEYPDILYNAATGLWACCSSNVTTGVQCSTATNDTWAAPAPDALVTIVSLQQAPPTSTSIATIAPQLSPSTPSTASPTPLGSSTITSPTIPPTSSPAPVPAPTSLSPSFSASILSISTRPNTAAATNSGSSSNASSSTGKARLSAGAEAGIGIGGVFGAVILVSLIYFAIQNLRKRTHHRRSNAGLFGGPDPSAENIANPHAFDRQPEEAGADAGLSYSYRPQRFTGEPQFPLEILGGPSRYEAVGRQRNDFGSGPGLR